MTSSPTTDSFQSDQGKILFLSDVHLGAPSYQESRARELRVCAMLEALLPETSSLVLVGDIFDYWFEYKEVVPRGYLRLLGTLAKYADAGGRIISFKGNHDMWQFGYLAQELGAEILREPQTYDWQGLRIHIAHGDGLGPSDHGYKFIKRTFANPLAQRLYAMLHPKWGIALARHFSGTSRRAGGHNPKDNHFFGEQEWLIQYSREQLAKDPTINWFIFGHRHFPIVYSLNPIANYLNLGDWLQFDTFAVLENGQLQLLQWKEGRAVPYTSPWKPGV